ncbi:MAG: sodium:hydrogen antiporter [Fibrobacteres bacterium]|nr:sodium:hydrogen antiporter [Fibrobacterota bacterium]
MEFAGRIRAGRMQSVLIQYVFLILIILGLVMIADRLRLAYPIVLVLGGLATSFIPAFGKVTISPDLVFFIFLPPLLYEASWQVSWKEFWKWRKSISSFAFPVVIVTSCVVAIIASALIPGFSLAFGFLLGGIVSPPDAISATTIMRQVKAPKTLVSIAEGESLLNDASSLIVFRFALAAVITGRFDLQAAAGSFFLVVAMGILIGLAMGLLFYGVHRWLPVSPAIAIILTFVTPYCMYYAAEHFHYSGVLAVVCGGLYLSHKRLVLLDFRSRLQGVNVWNSIVFLMNAVIFMLIGLQLPSIVRQLGDIGLATAIGYGLAITLALIATRMLCTFGGLWVTKIMSRFITVADADPGWRMALILGWAGIRGVVSLAAALAVPLSAGDGLPFPFRNLILFITFIVILVTLILQGLTLPWLIRKLNVRDKHHSIPEPEQERLIQKRIARSTLDFIEEKYSRHALDNEHLKNLKARLNTELEFFDRALEETGDAGRNAPHEYGRIYLELLQEQRRILDDMNHNYEFDEELIRKYQSLVDLEELNLRERYPLTADSR